MPSDGPTLFYTVVCSTFTATFSHFQSMMEQLMTLLLFMAIGIPLHFCNLKWLRDRKQMLNWWQAALHDDKASKAQTHSSRPKFSTLLFKGPIVWLPKRKTHSLVGWCVCSLKWRRPVNALWYMRSTLSKRDGTLRRVTLPYGIVRQSRNNRASKTNHPCWLECGHNSDSTRIFLLHGLHGSSNHVFFAQLKILAHTRSIPTKLKDCLTPWCSTCH